MSDAVSWSNRHMPVPILLPCRVCGGNKIPWMTLILGCPPTICQDCRKDYGDYERGH